MQYATLVQRILAGIIDGVILGVVFGCLIGICTGVTIAASSQSDTLAAVFSLAQLLLYCLFLIGYFAYFIIQEGGSGQTIGKKVMNIKVIKEDGSAMDNNAAMLRTVLRLVDALPTAYIIGIVLILTNEKKQRLGDIVAKTIVVQV